MSDIVSTYKKIYNLKSINLKSKKRNSIFFVFFDDKDCYSLTEDSFVTYSSKLRIKMTDIIISIEKLYNLKIYNFFPIAFARKNTILIACRIKDRPEKLFKCNEEMTKPFIDILRYKEKFFHDDYDDELILIENYLRRYNFYQNIIKGYILTEKKRRKTEYLNLLSEFIGDKAKSIIDISCGDNTDIFRTNNKANLIVGNDLNIYHIKNAQAKYKNVMFTNDNIIDLDYKDNFFDIGYCKNTLHHLNDEEQLTKTLNNIYRISKKIIIVEIEDPKETGGVPKFLNKYLYMKYLKDAGRRFLNFKEFKNTIDTCYSKKSNISYLSFENVLGKYMIAIIEKR